MIQQNNYFWIWQRHVNASIVVPLPPPCGVEMGRATTSVMLADCTIRWTARTDPSSDQKRGWYVYIKKKNKKKKKKKFL